MRQGVNTKNRTRKKSITKVQYTGSGSASKALHQKKSQSVLPLNFKDKRPND